METKTYEKMKGRTAIVTGALSGMGKATAIRLGSVGMQVALLDYCEDNAAEVAEEVRKAGGEAFFVKCDVCEEEQIRAAVDAVVGCYGKLNVLVNCAGIGSSMNVLHETDTTLFDRLIKLNLRGSFLMMKYSIQAMLRTKAENCSIVNFSSVAGLIASAGGSAYAISKFAIVGLTKSAAVDYAQHGIRVNAVCPYMVRTGFLKDVTEEQFKLYEQACANGRAADPDEIACAVQYLVSDMASYINGAILPIDAGKTAGDILPLEWKIKY